MRIFLAVLFLYSCSTFAEIRFEGKSYIACNTCTTIDEFEQAAKFHHLATFSEEHLSPRDIDFYVVLNMTTEIFNTIRVTRHYEESGEGRFQRVTTEQIANHADDTLYLYEYVAFEKINWLPLGNVDSNWYGNPDFLQSVSNASNQLIGLLNVNPFLFVDSNMKVSVSTNDGFAVVLVNNGVGEPNSWSMAFSATLSGRIPNWGPLYNFYEFYDSQGNVISTTGSFNENMECFVSLFNRYCMERVGESFFGPLYIHYRINKRNKPEPTRPPQCDFSEPDKCRKAEVSK
ncbi:hypothetical protein [Pleionea sediminis]|uniref:hypothetical protein n=1 Tax=Pleionea sediminis TaxID=2569479 RepID=UPI001186A1E3|nr:hypothetical protein [Pleionea sediminis]